MPSAVPTISAIETNISAAKIDALVLAVAKGENGPWLANGPLGPKAIQAIGDSLELLGVSGEADSVVRIPGAPELGAPVIILTGLGALAEGESPELETLRAAAGSVTRQINGVKSFAFGLPAPTVESAAAVAEGALLGAFRYQGYRTPKNDGDASSPEDYSFSAERLVIVTPAANDRALAPALERASVLAEASCLARTLVDQVPNFLYPESFAAQAKEAGKGLPLKYTVWDDKKLERDGFGGLIGVGKGSAHGPRLVKIEYTPAKAKARLALVGKGITFDSGGISLKPSDGMWNMKSDMAGAASVLATLVAVARLKLDVAVTGWLCLAENLPSGTAQKPSDVLSVFGGKTVEVKNTDAEGRLVMADALVAASMESPDALVDIATLTGAQMIALGTRTAGVMGNNPELCSEIVAAADQAGEHMWYMPMPKHLRASLNSKVADISNHGVRFGGMMTAATFLSEFVGSVGAKSIPWAHIDIAGPSYNEGEAHGYTPAEGTGFGTRTLVTYVENVSA
ncbi:leucyl aminopeptidase [Haematomicrobium sanguinis]|uniref:leucyl aminopeptidase n=1 Tax=Haematomicrobium sanguinis TaxID=479106 RepID=UPI000557D9CE|nr:leucyl aminopeptidase [Haematomicrobium sanguinis]